MMSPALKALRSTAVLRSVLIGALALVALTAQACEEGPTEPDQPTGPIPFETLARERNPSQNGGQIREVIRDEATWRTVWADLQRDTSLPATPPAVDFARDMVVVAAMPTQSCVASVTIESIQRSAQGLVVRLLESPPEPGCTCITSERPFHAVRLKRSPLPPRFDVTVRPGC